MELNWILEEPIDFEYKQYIILDYIKKTGEKLEKFELYPSFQDLSIHYTSVCKVIENGQYITLKNKPEDIDDEILLSDLIYNPIIFKSIEETEEILKIASFAKEKLQNLFMITKSLWSVVNETINLKLINSLDSLGFGIGYFFFNYGGEFYIYEYSFVPIRENSPEHKCNIKLLYKGDEVDVESIIIERGKHGINGEYLEKINNYGIELPIFKISIDQEFPLEGCLLSLMKRKVMNYIFQSVKIKQLND